MQNEAKILLAVGAAVAGFCTLKILSGKAPEKDGNEANRQDDPDRRRRVDGRNGAHVPDSGARKPAHRQDRQLTNRDARKIARRVAKLVGIEKPAPIPTPGEPVISQSETAPEPSEKPGSNPTAESVEPKASESADPT